MLHILEHALLDTIKALPLLFLAYLLIEYLEHKASHKFVEILSKPGVLGPVFGSLLGSVPQCGFSVAASNFYSGRVISMGTLIAVYIATSDEAIPILISHPEKFSDLWKIIVVKIILAVFFGILIDLAVKKKGMHSHDEPFHELCDHCDCDHKNVLRSAVHHTVQIIIFIFLVNLILGAAIEYIGEDNIGKLMLTDSIFQPLITALIGFIPNCASSVILTELFISGSISFGALISGLSTGAGVGIAVLFRTNKHHIKENLFIVVLLYLAAVISGLFINLFF